MTESTTTIATADCRAPIWPTASRAAAGVVYVATGRRYRDEAGVAAAQLKRSNPKLPICFITDDASGPRFWDDLILLKNPVLNFRDKIMMGMCPYERFLFLDTDTHVIGDLSGVFELLRHFDLAGQQLFEGHDCPLPDIPDAFPEFNTGVLGFRRSPRLADFFRQWQEAYDAFHALNRGDHFHYSNLSDQKSLRQTVYRSGLRAAILGPEYNFVPHHVNFACAEVRIIHGRGRENLENLARRLNAKLGNRAYVPRLDAVVYNDTPGPEMTRLWWMATLQLARRASVAITPVGLRNWLRRSGLVRRLFLRNRFGS